MANVGLRDIGSIVPGRVEPEATADSVVVPLAPRRVEPDPVLVTPPPPKRTNAGFGGDLPHGADALGIDATLAHVAELAVHERAASPLTIGLLGGAGAGKSFALGRLAQRIRDLAAAAGAAKASPFLSRVHVQAIDAASLEGEPALALAARLHAGLRQPFPDLARELGHAARDPHVVLREVNEKLDDARRRLDSERRALDDAGSRRARLTETVLYEAAGSQVDAYARANRPGIESRFNGFGVTGDAIRNYKDLVQYVSGAGRTGLALRSLYGFKGQTKLIVTAILLAAAGVGLGIAVSSQDLWLADLRAGPKAGAGLADWLEAHMSLLDLARNGAFALAALAILANLWRALAFVAPIFKGASLLDGDLDARRRDLDGLYAHQTKRVDMLDADVERLTHESAEAERRVGYTGPATLAEPSPFETAGAAQGQAFFSTLARLMAEPGSRAPQRIVLALDHLDAVPPLRARDILDAVHRSAGAGLVTLVAIDPARLDLPARSDLARWLQVPVQVGAGAGRDYGALVDAALGRGRAPAREEKLDASRTRLDDPIGDDEAALLAGMAGLAGPAPRGVKRLVNLYRLARLDDGGRGSDGHAGALALMLALAEGGTDEERAAVASALAARDQAASFDLPMASPRMLAALAAAVGAGGPFNIAAAGRAARRASTFALAPISA